MSALAITVQGLGKRYRIGQSAPLNTLFKSLRRDSRRDRHHPDHIWALKDVSFDIERGDVVGLIGPNGSGKTTLLKVLSRITQPTEGNATIYGRVGALLGVGTGFHAEMSGRDNVYLSGSVLGMRKAEIDRKFDEIVAFAGVEPFIDTPVKRYSSGMAVRLGFSVAAHLETEILLVDEVLSVGDHVFRVQSLNKMAEISGSGRTIIFVSHDLEMVARLCSKGILLNQGRAVCMGTAHECIEQYLTVVRQMADLGAAEVSLRDHPGRAKTLKPYPILMTGFSLLDEQGKPTWQVKCGGPLTAKIGYELLDGAAPKDANFAIGFLNLHNHPVSTCRSMDVCAEPIRVQGEGEVICRIPRLQLRPGHYKISLGCTTDAGLSDTLHEIVTIDVVGTDYYPTREMPGRNGGDVLFDHEWHPQPSTGPKEGQERSSALARGY